MRHLEPSLPTHLVEQVTAGKHYTCTGNASAWASPEIEERHSILNPFGEGWHLDRSAFDELLRDTVVNMNEYPLRGLVKGRMTQIDKNIDGTWSLSAAVPVGNTISATYHGRWIIDATGRKASIATKVGTLAY